MFPHTAVSLLHIIRYCNFSYGTFHYIYSGCKFEVVGNFKKKFAIALRQCLMWGWWGVCNRVDLKSNCMIADQWKNGWQMFTLGGWLIILRISILHGHFLIQIVLELNLWSKSIGPNGFQSGTIGQFSFSIRVWMQSQLENCATWEQGKGEM